MREERVQKILAQAGLGSRRACEKLIEAGRVTVNGKPVRLGAKANPQRDQIKVDGKKIAVREEMVYLALNKPRGVLSTTEEKGDARQTILDLVPAGPRLYPVGRLDIDSQGLILLTNDGELTNRLTHPRYGHEKEYRVLVAQHPDNKQLEAWRHGVVLEDGYRTAPADVRIEKTHGKGAWLRIVMREGRKRQIREVASRIGLPVAKLIRIRISSLQLGTLKPGQWRYLTPGEVAALQKGGLKAHPKKKASRRRK
jgi:23S rRNA pseudouridine2605 synthase